MNKERLKQVVGLSVLVYSAAELGRSALTVRARKEAGARDSWKCQGVDGEECYQASLNGGDPASFKDGYWVTLAHYKETHHLSGKGYHDQNPENARCLCTLCHATEEIDRGNMGGAAKMLNMGTYSRDHIRQTGEQEILTIKEALELRERARELSYEKKEGAQALEDKEALEHVREKLASVRGTRL